MREFIEKQLKDFDEAACIKLLKLFTVAALAVILYAAIYLGFQIVDEFEHLHAAWLVSIGEVPYRDFLEHHHPLLWYISAPVVSLFYDDAIIFYVMRGVSFCVSLLTVFYLGKIVLFFGNRLSLWLMVALFLGHLITIYNFYQFRPDNFMNLFFILGVYEWFCYLQKPQLKVLVRSFLWFTISFLFLQKISLLLAVVQLIMLYLIIRKKMSFKDVVIASVPSVMLLTGFFMFIYSQDAFFEYFGLNYRFNQAMLSYFTKGAFWYQHPFFTIYGAALVTAVYFFKKENSYFKILAVLYICEFIMRVYYFAPHPNYYTMLTMLAAVILSVWAKMLMPKHKMLSALGIIALFLYLGLQFDKIDRISQIHNSYQHYKLADYVHKNSNADDLLMNGYDKNFNIYRKDVSYYWFGLDMLLPVMEKEFGLENTVDVNALVYQFRPKFLYYADYLDLRALRTYGETKYTQRFIPELVKMLYTPTPFDNLLILK